MTAVEILKSQNEIEEANRQEKGIEITYKTALKEAQIEFNEATKEEWDIYEDVWKPARERWEEFAKPHHRVLLKRQVDIGRERDVAISKIRKDWKKCPTCGTLAARFQHFCSDDKCGTNLVTGNVQEKEA